MMKVLITGITGLLGSYMAKYYSDKADLFGLKRKDSDLGLLGDLVKVIQWYEGDINDFELMEEATLGKDLVIHAAGMVSFDSHMMDALLIANTHGTTNLVNAMLSHGGGKLVFISSVAALGKEEGNLSIDEDHKWSNSEMNTPYAISKHLAELEVWRGAQEGLQVMVFNPSVLLGKIADRRSSTEIYQYVIKGNKYYPLGNINYIDIRDAVKIMGALIGKGNWNERYIISKESIPYKDFFEELADVLGLKAPDTPLSAWIATLAVRWAGVYNLFAKQKLPLNRQTIRSAKMTTGFDNGKIMKHLNYRFVPLRQTLEWAKNV